MITGRARGHAKEFGVRIEVELQPDYLSFWWLKVENFKIISEVTTLYNEVFGSELDHNTWLKQI